MSNNILTFGFNNLYNPIFCNLFNTNNGFMQLSNSNFGNNMTTDPNFSVTKQNSEDLCLNKCKNDKWCTSYSYDTNSGKCTEYLNFPTEIVSNLNGVNSGYNLNQVLDYNTLSTDQKNNVKNKCINQYLNNTYTPNKKEVNFLNCLNIQNQDSSTTNLNIDAQCTYNIYKSLGIDVTTKDNSTYIDDPAYTNSKRDPVIDNYKKMFDNYNIGQNSISNINNMLKPSDSENKDYNNMIRDTNDTLYNQYTQSIRDKTDSMNNYSDDIKKKIGIENFENENKSNLYKNIAKFIILFIIILLIWYIIIMISK
jgi:hypothetical protein